MKHIKGYDFLRAVSIILVIVSHLGLYYILPEIPFIKNRIYNIVSGTTGVQIFFTLSGFLITYILINEKEKRGAVAYKNFYIRRFLRLTPPLLLFLITIFILMVLNMLPASKQSLIYAATYLYNFIPNRYYLGELGHTWSLGVEEQFYLLWPFVIGLFSKRKVLMLSVLVVFLCVFAIWYLPKLEWVFDYKHTRWFIPAVAPIIIGSFFAVLNTYKPKIIKQLISGDLICLLLITLLFLSPLYVPGFLLKYSYIFKSIAVSILLLYFFYNQESFILNRLEKSWFTYIGKISYGLYVYQGLFLRTGPGGDLLIQQLPYNLILTFLIAILSYELMERPILQLKKKFR